MLTHNLPAIAVFFNKFFPVLLLALVLIDSGATHA